MKHIKPYKLYESTSKLVSPTLSPITTYFETAQGSKYLLSGKGETKRWKSAHANTGSEDSGKDLVYSFLRDWAQSTSFKNRVWCNVFHISLPHLFQD